MVNKDDFSEDLVVGYPKSNKKIGLAVRPYDLISDELNIIDNDGSLSLHISPYGIKFQTPNEYVSGTLLKINVTLPDYWERKRQFVEYNRIDAPGTFRILAKVIKSEDVGKRGRKKVVLVQTVNIDSVDEQVLKSYLQDNRG